jgi:triose/dihydroxyacetone kinase / FAD-AMP lyase (cyclizing)
LDQRLDLESINCLDLTSLKWIYRESWRQCYKNSWIGADEDRSFSEISPGDKLVLLINNLGGLSGLELGAITWEIVVQLKNKYDIKPERVYSGTFMSTLNELGFSISLLKVVDLGLANGLDMLKLLDAPAETTAWPATMSSWK